VPPGRSVRHRRPAERKPRVSRKLRAVAVLVIVAGLLAVGAVTGLGSAGSAEPAVQAFLLDWQQAHYAQAAALTDGPAADVKTQLAAAYTDLDASNEFFALDHITQHGSTAVATFRATVNLAQSGQQWSYAGQFGLSASGGHWVIRWSPSVVNPALRAGDRLAVQTTFAPRAAVEDLDGASLLARSADYRIGVYPGQLKDPGELAAAFATLTGLNDLQVQGQIRAAPPGDFLSLLTLDQAQFGSLWPQLKNIAGLQYQQQKERVFHSSAQQVVGTVGSENSEFLRDEGAAYEPGMTIGLTGLEQTYQDQLAGTPTTSVVVVNAAGNGITRLWSSAAGAAGTPVRTTLSSAAQEAAVAAVTGQSSSAEIVAVDTSTGAVRAVASHEAGGLSLPAGGALAARVEPGMAFSIVSAAALLSSGVSVTQPVPCEQVAEVGGQTFSYQAAASSSATLAADFASGCGTAFANMSRTLSARQLTSTEQAFGLGSAWKLRLQAFSGSATAGSGEADVAAQATGTGVLTSPLGMAEIAAEVASGTGNTPTLTTADKSASRRLPLSAAQLTQLRQLMRLSVSSGSARAANVAGDVYGQAGVVKSGSGSYLSWFAGYRGQTAVAVLETGRTPAVAAAAAAGAFFKAAG
jgi:hypothetical protein